MGKVKDLLIEQMNEANQMVDADYEYEMWQESEGYVDFVNEELQNTKLRYSQFDVEQAIKYGVSAVNLPAEEVGVDVYSKLLQGKVFEYLNHIG